MASWQMPLRCFCPLNPLLMQWLKLLYMIIQFSVWVIIYIYIYTNLLLCSRFSVFALVELILTAIGFLFTLALGIIITIGTDDTCKAFDTINKEEENPFMP